ncbi:MAG: glycerol-3-phosphate 1-O-acyltransferase PlsY [Phycisphaerae bacterium]|nr:glycerol-3-phosphate 1-O-acyltransferase PlsY [Phycisphaerae bacterium]
MIQDPLIMFTLLPAVGYLAGSIPFGIIIAKLHGKNLRSSGSGNVGATNVGRVIGRKWGYICFLLDVLKGAIPTAAAGWLIGAFDNVPTILQQGAWLSVGAGCIFGHVFNIWLKFRGGKGVATSLGVVLGIFPYFTLPGLCAFALWIIVTLVTRYVSAGSIAAAAMFFPAFVIFNIGKVNQLKLLGIFSVVMGLLVIIKHGRNIRRLLNGTENKIRSRPTDTQD